MLDAGILFLFFTFALFCHIGRTKGHSPFLGLGSDAAQIASLAAALDQPVFFEGDGLLGDPDNFRFYSTVHIPILRALTKFTGSYGDSFISMQGLFVFLQLTGFYLLGLVLFKSRFWAAVFSIICIPRIWIGFATWWGYYPDPLPRQMFSALIGFILAAAVYWRKEPLVCFAVMVTMGLMMYVHPVRAPTMAFAIWLGFWVCKPERWSRKFHLLWLGLCGLSFLLIVEPFLVTYLSHHEHGRTENYALIHQIMQYRFNPDFTQVPQALARVPGILFQAILPAAGAWCVIVLTRRQRPKTYIVGLWLIGIISVSVIIPLVERAVEGIFGIAPIEVDLVRGVRFVIPILLLFYVWALVEVEKKAPWVARLGLIVIVFWFSYQNVHYYMASPRTTMRVLLGSQSVPRPNNELHQVIMALKWFTLPGSRILSSGVSPSTIRYAARRPVVYSYKDGGTLAYSNHAKLVKWYERALQIRPLKALPWTHEKMRTLIELAREWEAEYLVVDVGTYKGLRTEGTIAVWGNDSHQIWRLR